ncbi:helix-turn-helix domain-containing protein [Pantoea cypripedii]|uniref:XRE family transcriptional regulator n=1 Tax=Pantoea cypripedii TaxID=55209 RepID=A0A6B9GGI5_PANCY|nr:XRE family transcriptional regulator [Pantoea cypripedii]QGY32386.1 XRE family transcriptional regulator [Pantoea cypripedii]
MKDTDKITTYITRPEDNIFADLGFEPDEAAALLAETDREIAQAIELKKQLMVAIKNWMKASGHKQVEAAKLLHVSRPRLSDAVNQKTDKFTIDALVGMVQHTGKTVRMIVE